MELRPRATVEAASEVWGQAPPRQIRKVHVLGHLPHVPLLTRSFSSKSLKVTFKAALRPWDNTQDKALLISDPSLDSSSMNGPSQSESFTSNPTQVSYCYVKMTEPRSAPVPSAMPRSRKSSLNIFVLFSFLLH